MWPCKSFSDCGDSGAQRHAHPRLDAGLRGHFSRFPLGPRADFVHKAVSALEHSIHLLVVDLYPASSFDPDGIHGAIWDELSGRPDDVPEEKGAINRNHGTGGNRGNGVAAVSPLSLFPPVQNVQENKKSRKSSPSYPRLRFGLRWCAVW